MSARWMSLPVSGLLFVLLSAGFSEGASAADVIPPEPVDGKIRWVYSYDEGKKLAEAAGRPMFVVFRCER